MRATSRPIAANLALAAAATLSVPLAAEVALRTIGWSPKRHSVRIRISSVGNLSRRANSYQLDCYASNPDGAFPIDLRRPEAQAHYRELGFDDFSPALPDSPWCIEFRLNEYGVRAPHVGPKSPDVTRVVVIGDSFTEGQGIVESQLFTNVAWRELEREAPGRFEVINFGERGLDFPALYKQFERSLPTAPDLVVYAVCLNDGARSDAFDRRWPRLNDWIMVRRPEVRLGAWNSRLGAFVTDRIDNVQIARDTTEWYRGLYGEPNQAGWQHTKDYIRRMARAMDERGGRFGVAIWPLLVGLDVGEEYPFQEVHQRLARVAARNRIPLRDFYDVLRNRPDHSLWAHPGDWHANGLAHRLAGEELARFVRDIIGS